jgi:hypothetical protein
MNKPRDFMRERTMQVSRDMVETTDRIIEQIRPLLAGYNPTTQGAVIAELFAIWLGGHRPEIRQDMLKHTVDMAIDMITLHDPWKGRA